jgi:hybrid cluster-associated redox disulfide protein
MNEELKISDMTVLSLLRSSPKAVRFFLDRHLSCVGCGFARFCTLEDVIQTYHLPKKQFLEDAEMLLVQQTSNRSTE